MCSRACVSTCVPAHLHGPTLGAGALLAATGCSGAWHCFVTGTAPGKGNPLGGCMGVWQRGGAQACEGGRGGLELGPAPGKPWDHPLPPVRPGGCRPRVLRPPAVRGRGGRGERQRLGQTGPVPRQLLLLRWHPLPRHPRPLRSGVHVGSAGLQTAAATCVRPCRCGWCPKPGAVLRQDCGVLREVLGARICPICSRELGVPLACPSLQSGVLPRSWGGTCGQDRAAWGGTGVLLSAARPWLEHRRAHAWAAGAHACGARQDRCRACSVAALCCHCHGSAQHPPAPRAPTGTGPRGTAGGCPKGRWAGWVGWGQGQPPRMGDILKERCPGHQRG